MTFKYVLRPFIRVLFSTIHYMQAGNLHRQYDLNDMNLQAASGRIPPSWSPENERRYPFAQYQQDLNLWIASADVDENRQAALVALRLGGSAKLLAREMDVEMLQNGALVNNPLGGQYDGNGQLIPLQIGSLAFRR